MVISNKNHELKLKEAVEESDKNTANALMILQSLCGNALKGIQKWESGHWGTRRALYFIKDELSRAVSVANQMFPSAQQTSQEDRPNPEEN